jgi:hypothetical protein
MTEMKPKVKIIETQGSAITLESHKSILTKN